MVDVAHDQIVHINPIMSHRNPSACWGSEWVLIEEKERKREERVFCKKTVVM